MFTVIRKNWKSSFSVAVLTMSVRLHRTRNRNTQVLVSVQRGKFGDSMEKAIF